MKDTMFIVDIAAITKPVVDINLAEVINLTKDTVFIANINLAEVINLTKDTMAVIDNLWVAVIDLVEAGDLPSLSLLNNKSFRR